MSSSKLIEYRGLLLPPQAHNAESLEFAQKFSVEDSDVFIVTYPKSGKLHS
uniref:Sulfotransferase n=1 Tax=Cyprinodon variegatus TaxID=28743 RepID=A0A3Q2CZ93_CYPVA